METPTQIAPNLPTENELANYLATANPAFAKTEGMASPVPEIINDTDVLSGAVTFLETRSKVLGHLKARFGIGQADDSASGSTAVFEKEGPEHRLQSVFDRL